MARARTTGSSPAAPAPSSSVRIAGPANPAPRKTTTDAGYGPARAGVWTGPSDTGRVTEPARRPGPGRAPACAGGRPARKFELVHFRVSIVAAALRRRVWAAPRRCDSDELALTQNHAVTLRRGLVSASGQIIR
jgi:hypothetical protein